jgi:NifB/MoaA-like Fe-S oxidoreductase
VVDSVEEWQAIFLSVLGRRVVFAADEYYLRAARPFPPADVYEGFPMHEDGIGMAQAFAAELRGDTDDVHGTKAGFFAWVDGAPAEGYRAPRLGATDPTHSTDPTSRSGTRIGAQDPRSWCQNGEEGSGGVAILTGELGARVLAPLVAELGRGDVRVVAVQNRFFGGNIGVTGLLVGEDLARVLADQPEGHRYLLPDVCLSEGRFLDGTAPADLPRIVEVIPTDGRSLRRALAQAVSAPS